MGVSKIVKNALAAQNTRVGTPLYLSPELVKQKPYDYKIDVWAMGCILYQMCTGKAPFTGENLISLGYSIVHNQPPTIPSTYSTELSEIVMKLLEKNPAKRPSSAEAFTLVGQYRKQNKQGSILNLKTISSKAQLSEAGEKKQITTYGNGVHALVDKEDLVNPDHPAIDGGEKKPKEILKSSSPRRTKLARVLGKTDSKNLNLMNAHLKKESMHQFHQEREADNFSRVQSQLLHVSNAGASKKQLLDSSDQNIKQSDLGLFKDKSNIDSQANLEILKPRISPSEVDLSRENQKGNRVSQRSEKPAHEKVQTSSYEAHPPTIPQNHSAHYIRPVRNIQSAYGENKHSGNKLIVNSKKMPDKIKCIELMLKRAILNDPVHNMLKGNQQSANNLNNPYSPPLPTSKSPSSGFEKQLSKEYKESVNEPKTGKITMGSLPTGGLELIEKAKIYQNEGATQEGTTSSQNLICHPFIDPFKKHVATPIGNKSDGRFLQKETVQTSENIEAPRREMYRAKMRPQTASANLHSRPNSAYSGVTGGALGNSKERITEGQPLLTDNRNYRIKTAVGSSKKDVPQANVGYSKQPVYYADKKVTIHDL